MPFLVKYTMLTGRYLLLSIGDNAAYFCSGGEIDLWNVAVLILFTEYLQHVFIIEYPVFRLFVCFWHSKGMVELAKHGKTNAIGVNMFIYRPQNV